MSSNAHFITYNSFVTSEDLKDLKKQITDDFKQQFNKYDIIIDALSQRGVLPNVSLQDDSNLFQNQDSLSIDAVDVNGINTNNDKVFTWDGFTKDDLKSQKCHEIDKSLGKYRK